MNTSFVVKNRVVEVAPHEKIRRLLIKNGRVDALFHDGLQIRTVLVALSRFFPLACELKPVPQPINHREKQKKVRKWLFVTK